MVKHLFKVMLGSLKWLWRLAFVVVFLVSMAFNIVAVVGGTLFNAVSNTVESATGIKTMVSRHADEVGLLTQELDARKSDIAKLESEAEVQNKRIVSLSDELEEARVAQTVTYRNQRKLLTEAVEDTSQRISQRTIQRSARNVSAVFAEAIPVVGVAVVVGVTGLELRDSCNTLKDLKELEKSFNPTVKLEDDVQQVCGLEVPTKEEVWESVKSSPAEAWAGIEEYDLDLGELQLPKLSFEGTWEAVTTGATSAWKTALEAVTATWLELFDPSSE